MNTLQNYNVNIINYHFSTQTKHVINEKVETIFVINLLSNKLRRNYVIMLMKKYKINFTLVIVEPINNSLYNLLNKNKKLSKSEIGCTLSHMWCLNKIKCEKLNSAIILEDDIIFHKQFKQLFTKLFYFPNKYDFLLLGACDFSFSKINYQYVNTEGLYRPHPSSSKVYGAHAIYYSLQGAQKMFEYLNENIYFVDRNFHYMFHQFPNSSFICYPNLIVSDISTTNNNHEYPFFSNNEKNYYLDCFQQFQFNNYHFFYLSLIQNISSFSISILDTDTYEKFMNRLIEVYFSKKDDQLEIKKRLDFHFFTINDMKILLNL